MNISIWWGSGFQFLQAWVCYFIVYYILYLWKWKMGCCLWYYLKYREQVWIARAVPRLYDLKDISHFLDRSVSPVFFHLSIKWMKVHTRCSPVQLVSVFPAFTALKHAVANLTKFYLHIIILLILRKVSFFAASCCLKALHSSTVVCLHFESHVPQAGEYHFP